MGSPARLDITDQTPETTRMSEDTTFSMIPIGYVRSPIENRKDAPRQGFRGGVEAWVEVAPEVADGLLGVEAGQEVVLITWLHESVRDVLQVYPRWKEDLPLTGVFLTRSPDRPNPLGLHRVTILEVDGERLRVVPLEVIDGTPVVDIKAVMSEVADW
jgi:tRNA-Thr(GGU) m(6)t(6)A37 methyltransferase TsaA